MTHLHQAHRLTASGVLAVTLLLALPLAVAAHAELVDASPADGEIVEGTPPIISAEFSEPLVDGSSLRLVDATGGVVAEGKIDPNDDTRMVIEPPELVPGTYEVRWQARSADTHVERDTYTFTVTAEATPAPTRTPGSTAAPTAPTAAPTVTPTVAPTPSPSEPDGTPAADSGDALIPIVAALVLIALLGGYLLSRRRSTPRP